MDEPLTEELLAELRESPSVDAYLADNTPVARSLADYLQELLDAHHLERAQVVHDAQLNDTYGYQIFMGQRNPSRDKVLQLAFAMGLPLTETNRLCQAAGVNPLYVKNRRDAIIIFALDHSYTLQKVNEELYRFGEKTLC